MFRMADQLNGQALPVHHTKPYKNYNLQNDGTSRYFGVWLGLGSFFPVVCFIHVFDQTLPEQLYRDKRLFLVSRAVSSYVSRDSFAISAVAWSGAYDYLPRQRAIRAKLALRRGRWAPDPVTTGAYWLPSTRWLHLALTCCLRECARIITVTHKRGYQVAVICLSSELTKTHEAEEREKQVGSLPRIY